MSAIMLRFLVTKGQALMSFPVSVKSEAQAIVDVLTKKAVSGIRVSYMCPVQGCEVILYKAKSPRYQLIKV